MWFMFVPHYIKHMFLNMCIETIANDYYLLVDTVQGLELRIYMRFKSLHALHMQTLQEH